MALETLVGAMLALALSLPLAWKWQLGVRRVGIAVGALAVAAGIVVTALGSVVDLGFVIASLLVCGLALAASVAVLAWRFYRDPERTPPAGDGLVVSPADGEVVYVRRSSGGRIPVSTKHGHDHALEELTRTPLELEDAHIVGIAMSFLDVHVNRAPIGGVVKLRRHFAGTFGSLRDADMVFRNERATTVIEQGGLEVAVVQIASRLVRQIAGTVEEGQRVDVGERIGVIRLGSQVDVVIPSRPGVEVVVAEGDRVRAGESVIARVGEP